MRTVQETFDCVIQAGIYNPYTKHNPDNTPWMCFALGRAHDRGILSWEECSTAKHAIQQYIRGAYTMCGVLYALEDTMYLQGIKFDEVHPMDCADRLIELYSNWDERPELPEDLFDDYP